MLGPQTRVCNVGMREGDKGVYWRRGGGVKKRTRKEEYFGDH